MKKFDKLASREIHPEMFGKLTRLIETYKDKLKSL